MDILKNLFFTQTHVQQIPQIPQENNLGFHFNMRMLEETVENVSNNEASTNLGSSDDNASDHSIGDYIKLAVIALKIVLLVYKLTMIMYTNTKLKTKHCVLMNVIAAYFICELIAIFVFDLTHKYVMGFYVCFLVSTFCQFLLFNLLLRTDVMSNDSNTLKKLQPFNIIYMLAFIAIVVLSFIPGVGAYCQYDGVYPIIYLALFLLHLTLCSVIYAYYKKNMFIHKDYYYVEGTSDLAIDTSYRKQICCFSTFNFVIGIMQVVVGIAGVFGLKYRINVLACEDDQNTWLQINGGGNVFITLHVIFIIMQSSIFILTFYQYPMKAGVYSPDKLAQRRQMLQENSSQNDNRNTDYNEPLTGNQRK
eukprot:403360221